MGVRRDYLCSNCGHFFEHYHSSIKEKKRKCPQCGKNKLEAHFGDDRTVFHVYNDPTTFIHQADRNSKKKPHLAEKHEHDRKEEFEKKYGMDYEQSKKEREKIEKINKMTDEQKENYMMNGDI